MYVKIWNENIKNTGKVDCGCEIVKVESPHITMKLCKLHEGDVKSKIDLPFVSLMINNPGKFEHIHLAAIGSKEFEQ